MKPASTLEELLIKDAIREQLYAHAREADSGSASGMVTVFSEDCQVNYRQGDKDWIDGRAALEAFLTEVLDRYRATDHTTTNIEVEIREASVESWSCVLARHVYKDERDDFVAYGRFHDNWRREGDRWLIERRRYYIAHAEGRDVTETHEPWPRVSRPS